MNQFKKHNAEKSENSQQTDKALAIQAPCEPRITDIPEEV